MPQGSNVELVSANGSEGRAASAHFVVDEGDTVYQCVPLDVVAWAVGDGRSGKFGKVYGNYNTVSIEMVSHTRLDCVVGSTALMRQAVTQAAWHVAHRWHEADAG